MDRVPELLEKALAQHEGAWVLDESALTVRLGGGSRHQDIEIDRDGADYVLTSVVLSAREVTKSHSRWRELARLAWLRNAQHEVVTFGFDDRDRLIGTIRHPAEHLDPEELSLYIVALSRECDRFEYLLTGADIF